MLHRLSSRTAARRGPTTALIIILLAAAGIFSGSAGAAGGRRERSNRAPRPYAEAPADSLSRADTLGEAIGDPVPPPPEPSRATRLLHRKTKAYDLVKMGESLRIGPDEVVRGDVVILGGNLRVDGEIVGGAVVVGGNIEAGPQASIGGEAVAVGGRVDAAPGASVRGGIVSLNFLPAPLFRGLDWGRAHRVATLVGDFFTLGFWLLAAALFLVFVSERLRRARTGLEAAFLKCFGLGVLGLTGGLFAALVAIVLLAITLIGIPLALLLAFLCAGLLAAALITGALLVGDKVCSALNVRSRSQFLHTVVGILTLLLPKLLADVLSLAVPFSGGLSFALYLMHAAFMLTALAAGLGALVLTKLGARVPLPGPAAPPPGVGLAATGPPDYEPFHEAEPPLGA